MSPCKTGLRLPIKQSLKETTAETDLFISCILVTLRKHGVRHET